MSRCLPEKNLIDEQVLFIMSHGVAKIHILHTPAVAFKLMHNYFIQDGEEVTTFNDFID